MSEAIFIVHWPGKDVFACSEHAVKLRSLAETLGFPLSIALVDLLPDQELVCSNCENERTKKGGEP